MHQRWFPSRQAQSAAHHGWAARRVNTFARPAANAAGNWPDAQNNFPTSTAEGRSGLIWDCLRRDNAQHSSRFESCQPTDGEHPRRKHAKSDHSGQSKYTVNTHPMSKGQRA